MNVATADIGGGANDPTGKYQRQYEAFLNNITSNFVTDSDFPAVTDTSSSGGGGTGGYYRAAAPAVDPYKAAQLPSATSQEDYINAMYDANERQRREALAAEYAANIDAIDQQSAALHPQYRTMENAAAGQAALNQAQFNERAAAYGINTGAGSQAALAQNNALLGEISAIRRQEQQAADEIEAERAALTRRYQAAISEAIAENDAQRAQALYQEAIRVNNSIVDTALSQADENYRAWQAAYSR